MHHKKHYRGVGANYTGDSNDDGDVPSGEEGTVADEKKKPAKKKRRSETQGGSEDVEWGKRSRRKPKRSNAMTSPTQREAGGGEDEDEDGDGGSGSSDEERGDGEFKISSSALTSISGMGLRQEMCGTFRLES